MSDVLDRAARALREAHDGQHPSPGFTRARVMATLHQKRRRSVLRWVVFAPLASLGLIGSVWAHGAGKWPAVWRAVAAVFVSEPSGSAGAPAPTPPPRREAAPLPALRDPPTAAAPEPENAAGEQAAQAPLEAAAELPEATAEPPERTAEPPEATEPPQSTAEPPEPPPQRERSTRRAPMANAPAASAPAAASPSDANPSSQAAADPEIARFRAAHDLHFSGDRPREAIAAYAAYLAEFPSGRFVPEARYNSALNWIKLGEKARARAALEPFAAGAFGHYRRDEARRLLEALR